MISPWSVLEINVGTREITTEVYSVCLNHTMLSCAHVANTELKGPRKKFSIIVLFSGEPFSYPVCIFLCIPLTCLGLHYFTFANTSILLYIVSG